MELFWNMTVLLIACGTTALGDTDVFDVLAKQYGNVILDCPNTLQGPSIWLIPSDNGLVTYSVGSVISDEYKHEKYVYLVKNEINENYDLTILNITKKNAGQYKCQGVEDGELTDYSFHLRILEKPKVHITDDEYKAMIGESVFVSVIVETLQTPTVSWSKTAGGTLGDWKVATTRKGNYTISSTILPMVKMHLGLYSIEVRNDAGSRKITIKLSEKDSPIVIRPTIVYCNSSSQTIVNCTMTTKSPSEWKNYWLHTRNGKFIQRITGLIKDNTSSINIKFCDYKEEGEYKCIWEKGFQTFSDHVVTVVKGPPVITRTSINSYRSCFCLEIYTYSYSNIIDVVWFRGQKKVQKTSNYSITVRESIVQLSYWDTNMKEKGYVTTLCVTYCSITDAYEYSCQVQSLNGRVKFRFHTESIVKILYRVEGVQTTLQHDNLDNKTDDHKKSISSSNFERQAFLYTLLPLGLIIVTIGLFSIVTFFRTPYESSEH